VTARAERGHNLKAIRYGRLIRNHTVGGACAHRARQRGDEGKRRDVEANAGERWSSRSAMGGTPAAVINDY